MKVKIPRQISLGIIVFKATQTLAHIKKAKRHDNIGLTTQYYQRSNSLKGP